MAMSKSMNTKLNIYGQLVDSRLLIGSALYPSPEIMKQAILASGSKIVTLSLKRQNPAEQAVVQVVLLIFTQESHIMFPGFRKI